MIRPVNSVSDVLCALRWSALCLADYSLSNLLGGFGFSVREASECKLYNLNTKTRLRAFAEICTETGQHNYGLRHDSIKASAGPGAVPKCEPLTNL